MSVRVEIDPDSGFCGGVIRAITTAQERLASHPGEALYSLGAIVHNEAELSRLSEAGLVTIEKEDMERLSGGKTTTLLIRAHGEPPQTYQQARALGFGLIDCTCPVVLQLQKSIRQIYADMRMHGIDGQIIIFGKVGHAEVLGLVGQVGGDAIVVQDIPMLDRFIAEGRVRVDVPTHIFSQTTKNPEEYVCLCNHLKETQTEDGSLEVHDTICSQVATRHERLSSFAKSHDVVIFVSGKSSSNGAVLCDLCKSLNIRTYHVTSKEEIRQEWFRNDDSVGVCGATSTPKWLLEDIAAHIEFFAR